MSKGKLIETPVDEHIAGVGKEGGKYRGAEGSYNGQNTGLPERTSSPNAVDEKFYHEVPGVDKGKH